MNEVTVSPDDPPVKPYAQDRKIARESGRAAACRNRSSRSQIHNSVDEGTAYADASINEPSDEVAVFVGARDVAVAVLDDANGTALPAGVFEFETVPAGAFHHVSFGFEFVEGFEIRSATPPVDV